MPSALSVLATPVCEELFEMVDQSSTFIVIRFDQNVIEANTSPKYVKRGDINYHDGPKGYVEFQVEMPAGIKSQDQWHVATYHTAQDSRPLSLEVEGELVSCNIASGTSGSWSPPGRKWFFNDPSTPIRLPEKAMGKKTAVFRFFTEAFFPHVYCVVLQRNRGYGQAPQNCPNCETLQNQLDCALKQVELLQKEGSVTKASEGESGHGDAQIAQLKSIIEQQAMRLKEVSSSSSQGGSETAVLKAENELLRQHNAELKAENQKLLAKILG